MFDLREIGERITRVRRMAINLGLDLDAEVERGKLTPQAAQAAVRRCLTCEAPADCSAWLENDPDGALHPPAYCRNRFLFARLRDHGGADREKALRLG